MAKKLLDTITNTVKKISEAAKNVEGTNSNEIIKNNDTSTTTYDNHSWIGNGGKSSSTVNNNVPNANNIVGSSYTQDIERLSELQRKQKAEALKRAKEQALTNLDIQEQEIAPRYQEQRNLASSTSQQGAKNFAEYLANRGLTNSGASAQAEINRQSALQNTYGQLGTAEANAFRDIGNQRTQIQNNYSLDLANANAQIEADKFNKMLEENNRKRLQEEQWKSQSLYQYADNYQAQIDELIRQGYSQTSPEVLQLQALRGQKIVSNVSNATNPDNALASIQSGNINYNNASALGWTVAQAQQYHNNYIASIQAQAQQEAEQQAFENYIKQQQLNNSIANTTSLIQNRTKNNSNSDTMSLSEVTKSLNSVTDVETAQRYVDTLLDNGLIDENVWKQAYALNGWIDNLQTQPENTTKLGYGGF